MTSCIIEADGRSRADREAAEQQASDRETHAIDLRVLRLIVDPPTWPHHRTGSASRSASGVISVYAALARLLGRGWVAALERQRRPYTITETGRVALTEARA